jgi:hypothetical protein
LGLKHGWEANGRLAPRERRIYGKGPVSRACNKSLQLLCFRGSGVKKILFKLA